jgi:hypothetical protein
MKSEGLLRKEEKNKTKERIRGLWKEERYKF